VGPMTDPAAPSDAVRAALEREFPQRAVPGLGSLEEWRRGLPTDYPVFNVHGDYIGRLDEIHRDTDHLSCLGCGQIGTPSTYSSMTGIYLCAERCVPAISADRLPAAAPLTKAGGYPIVHSFEDFNWDGAENETRIGVLQEMVAVLLNRLVRLPAAAPVDRERFREALAESRVFTTSYNDVMANFEEIVANYNRLAGQSSSQPVGGEDRGDG
jgi:hypothetical protein